MDETVPVTLPAEMLRALRESVASGESPSLDAALSEAVRLWQRERADHAERIAAIKARIRRSLDDSGPDLTGEEVSESLEELFAQAERDERRRA